MWYGVNVLENNVDDMMKKWVWEPEQVRINVLLASCEAACSILGVDQTIRNPKSEQQAAQAAGRLDGSTPPPGRGARGRGRGGRGQIPGFKTMQGRGGK
jgi:T-complex protein 1 subunit eta